MLVVVLTVKFVVNWGHDTKEIERLSSSIIEAITSDGISRIRGEGLTVVEAARLYNVQVQTHGSQYW